MNGKDDIGVAGIDREQHRSGSEEHVAGGDMADLGRALAQNQRPAFVNAFEHAGNLLMRSGGRGCACPDWLRAPARHRGSGRSLARARPHTISRNRSRGDAKFPAASVTGRQAPRSRWREIRCRAGWCARLMPMPMASHRGAAPAPLAEFQKNAGDLLAIDQHVIGPFHAGLRGRRQLRHGIGHGQRRHEGQLRAFAGRLFGPQAAAWRRDCQSASAIPAPAGRGPPSARSARIQTGAGAPAAASRRASSLVESISSNSFSA